MLMSAWHVLINLFMTMPLIYACVKVTLGYNDLAKLGFQPTTDETEAKTASLIMLGIPVVVVLVSIFNWKLLKIYYASGHPWSRIYREFPCNNKSPGKDLSNTMNV